MRTTKLNLTGERFERLTIVAKISGTEDEWVARCVCKKYLKLNGRDFRERKLFCCGCRKHPVRRDHPLWNRWYLNRRRKTLCNKWHRDFDQFAHDVSTDRGQGRLQAEGRVLLRRNAKQQFGPDNFYWADKQPAFPPESRMRLQLQTDNGPIYLAQWIEDNNLTKHKWRVNWLYRTRFVETVEHMTELVKTHIRRNLG